MCPQFNSGGCHHKFYGASYKPGTGADKDGKIVLPGAPIAQLAEQQTLNLLVQGSIPCGRTINMEKNMADFQGIADALIKGQAPVVKELVQEAVNENVSPEEILIKGLIEGMSVIGVRFKKNEVYVPEVLIAARAMKTAMEILEPKLVEAGVEPLGNIVIGTVQGDLHDIGKNLVAMMMEGAGFEIVDLGTDVGPDVFVAAAKKGPMSSVSLRY